MMKKFAWSAVSLALSAIAAYVFLLDRSQPPEAADALRPVQQAEPSRIAPDTRTSPTGQGAAIVPDPVVRTTRTVGDLKVSRFKGGDIGYLDVDSIIKNDDPYSIVALLQEHRDLTGADESLDLEIRFTRDYPAGKSVSFRQLINGKPTKGGGKGSLTFDPATGAVKSGYSSLLNPQPANAMSAFISAAEALHMGGTDHRWKYGDKDFTTKPEDFADMHVTVAHAMYRIYKKIGDKDKAFRFVLAVDEEMPESDEVAETFLEVAEKSNMATEVTEVLTDMGLIQANYNFFADEYEDPIDKAEDLWSWYLEWLEEWLEDELHEEL